MGEIRIRNLDEATLARLNLRARELGISAEDLLRDLIAQTFGTRRDDLLRRIDDIRAMTPPGPQTDSVAILREIRDGRPAGR